MGAVPGLIFVLKHSETAFFAGSFLVKPTTISIEMNLSKLLIKREMIFCYKFGMDLEDFFSSLPGFGFDFKTIDGQLKIAVPRDGVT